MDQQTRAYRNKSALLALLGFLCILVLLGLFKQGYLHPTKIREFIGLRP